MSKIKPDKINFNDSDFVIEIDNNTTTNDSVIDSKIDETIDEKKRIIDNANNQKNKIIEEAENQKNEIIDDANNQKNKIIEEAENQAKSITEKAEKEAQEKAKNITDDANKQALDLLEKSKAELEKQITTSANEGYAAGYKDGLEKIQEELNEKIEDFEKFCTIQGEIKNKILKSAAGDILNLIINISKKVLLREINGESLAEIIDKTISLIEKKEDINIILSEKYAKLLYDFQNNSLNEEIEFKFEDFKQYKGFNLIYNSKFADDTIIVENPTERYDASINSQLDIIIRDIYENTQNGKLENIEQYNNETE